MPAYALTSILDTACCFGVASLLLLRSRRQAWILALLLYAIGLWMALPWVLYAFPEWNPLFVVRSFFGIGACVPNR